MGCGRFLSVQYARTTGFGRDMPYLPISCARFVLAGVRTRAEPLLLVRSHFFARIREGREPERRGARAAAASRPHRASARFVLRRAARWRASARRPSLPFISRLVMRSIPPRASEKKRMPEGEGGPSSLSMYDARQ